MPVKYRNNNYIHLYTNSMQYTVIAKANLDYVYECER